MWLITGLALAGTLAHSQTVLAQAPARVAWLEPVSPSLLERVRGQLTDLAITLEVVALPTAEPRAQAALIAALPGDVQVALLVEPLPATEPSVLTPEPATGYRVRAFERSTQRWLSREVHGEDGR